jgi:hypothetical protein
MSLKRRRRRPKLPPPFTRPSKSSDPVGLWAQPFGPFLARLLPRDRGNQAAAATRWSPAASLRVGPKRHTVPIPSPSGNRPPHPFPSRNRCFEGHKSPSSPATASSYLAPPPVPLEPYKRRQKLLHSTPHPSPSSPFPPRLNRHPDKLHHRRPPLSITGSSPTTPHLANAARNFSDLPSPSRSTRRAPMASITCGRVLRRGHATTTAACPR